MIDPEILTGFREETQQLLKELTEIAEKIEEAEGVFPTQEVSDFAQRIDRIMGAAKTLAQMDPQDPLLPAIGSIGEICKATGYQAAKTAAPPLAPIFAAFWAETLEFIEEAVGLLDQPLGPKQTLLSDSFPRISKRLEWLRGQVARLAGTSPESQLAQTQIDALIAKLKP